MPVSGARADTWRSRQTRTPAGVATTSSSVTPVNTSTVCTGTSKAQYASSAALARRASGLLVERVRLRGAVVDAQRVVSDPCRGTGAVLGAHREDPARTDEQVSDLRAVRQGHGVQDPPAVPGQPLELGPDAPLAREGAAPRVRVLVPPQRPRGHPYERPGPALAELLPQRCPRPPRREVARGGQRGQHGGPAAAAVRSLPPEARAEPGPGPQPQPGPRPRPDPD